MRTSNETLRRLERLHVRAWPASETARIDGWLWRWSGGASQRANSVSTIDFIGNDLAAALDRVEARYRAKAARSQVHTFDLGQPPGLAGILTDRGYAPGETTLTMLATAPPPMQPAGRYRAAPSDATSPYGPLPDPVTAGYPVEVVIADVPDAEWLEVYLAAVTYSRRAVNRQILRRIPDPRAFFSIRRGGRVISTALGVADGGHAVAECVATRQDARGSRGAEAAMCALMQWAASLGAHSVGLQVVDSNAPALRLYRRLGFQAVCTNRFWAKP